MKCPHCQVENREGARFCLACGKRLAAPEDIATPETEGPQEILTSPGEPIGILDSEISATLAPEAEPPKESEKPLVAEPPQEGPQVAAGLVAEERIQRAAPAESAAETGHEPESPPPAQVTAPPVKDVLSPLEPGTVVDDRFEIVELLEPGVETNLYSARVLTICPSCGFEDNQPGDRFCEECGIELQGAGPPVMRKVREALSPDIIGVEADDGVFHDGRFYLLLPEEEMVAIPSAEPAFPYGMTLSVGYASDVGQRDLDEDSLCVFTLAGVYESVVEPSMGLFIVADGMGGHEGGEVASKLTVQIIADQLVRDVLLRRFTEEEQPLGEAIRAHLIQAISDANERVYHLARERANDMGCTLTMALVIDG